MIDKKHIMKYTVMTAYALFVILFYVSIGVAHTEANPQEDYRAYVMGGQYIGDVAGCEDCLIMSVVPLNAHTNNSGLNFEVTGGSHLLYFADEHELHEAEDNDIIIVRWLVNPIFGWDHIDGVETIGSYDSWTTT